MARGDPDRSRLMPFMTNSIEAYCYPRFGRRRRLFAVWLRQSHAFAHNAFREENNPGFCERFANQSHRISSVRGLVVFDRSQRVNRNKSAVREHLLRPAEQCPTGADLSGSNHSRKLERVGGHRHSFGENHQIC